MSWPELTVESWAHFTEFVELSDRGPAGRPNYVARGQSDATWGLTPSLNRQLGPGIAHEHVLSLEAELKHEFVSQAANHISAEMLGGRHNHLQKWSVMQHHGAPTRLLDWTLSPFVAAYFAVDVWHPNPQTLRMAAQQGCFTVAANPLTSHEDAIARLVPQQEEVGAEFLRKIVVPASQKRTFLRKLRMMNIAAKALFPGVDGLGRSTAELLRLR